MNKIFLIENHDEALKFWKQKKIKALDLVHIDAHIDFNFIRQKPIEEIFNKAISLEGLKRSLENSLVLRNYVSGFEGMVNIGNYIYQAINEGIVKNFYWVVPGGLKEFNESSKFMIKILRVFSRKDPYYSGSASQALRYTLKEGIISSRLFGRRFFICTLEKLPVLRRKVLLDIDTDFLIVDNLLNANKIVKLGKRKPWILAKVLVDVLKKKVRQPEIITIAYSVNGGFTPMKYKHIGDEIAYLFSPKQFRKRFKNNHQAANYFAIFSSSNKRKYYREAVKLNPSYRAKDNNYGPLYLEVRKFSKAKKEFLRIVSADPKNPFSLCGIGNIALKNKEFKKAERYFYSALKESKDALFSKAKSEGLLGLGQAKFGLNDFKSAKRLLVSYLAIEPMSPDGYYLLARIYEKEGNFEEAVAKYKDALKLGLNNLDVIKRLLSISLHIEGENDIIKFIIVKYREFKDHFLRTKRLSLGRNKKIKNLRILEKKMAALERSLEKVKWENPNNSFKNGKINAKKEA